MTDDITTNFSSDPTLVEIRNLADLQRYFGTYDATLGALNRRLYKDTACGAHLSVQSSSGTWHHNGEHDWMGPIRAIQIGSIVEGSDAEVDGDVLDLPVQVAELNTQIAAVEDQANTLWHEANDSQRLECKLCDEVLCEHEQDEHTRLHLPEVATYVVEELGLEPDAG